MEDFTKWTDFRHKVAQLVDKYVPVSTMKGGAEK